MKDRWYLRGNKLVQKTRATRLVPQFDNANAPPLLPLATDDGAVHNLGSYSVDDGGDDWFTAFDSAPVGPPIAAANDQPPNDGWDWGCDDQPVIDDVHQIDGASQQHVNDPGQMTQEDYVNDFDADAGYEDPVIDLAEASGPVQANAPPLDAPPEDAWAWVDEDTEEWVLLEPAQPQAADQSPEDIWPWWDDFDEQQPFGDGDDDPVGPDQPPVPEDGWLWLDEDLGDDWTADETLSADAAAALVGLVPDDSWDWTEDPSEAPLDESGPVVADVVQADQPPADVDWVDEVDDELVLESAPVGVDQIDLPSQESWHWDSVDDVDEGTGADEFGNDNADIQTADAWDHFDDAGADELVEESATVPADVFQVPQPVELDWAHDEPEDEITLESGPVVDDQEPVPADAPTFDDELDNQLLLDDVQLEDEPNPPQPDAWAHFEDELDNQLLLDDVQLEDEPDPPQPDPWNHFEEVEDDDHGALVHEPPAPFTQPEPPAPPVAGGGGGGWGGTKHRPFVAYTRYDRDIPYTRRSVAEAAVDAIHPTARIAKSPEVRRAVKALRQIAFSPIAPEVRARAVAPEILKDSLTAENLPILLARLGILIEIDTTTTELRAIEAKEAEEAEAIELLLILIASS